MNAPETNRFDELVSRYLDGELNEGERAELLQSLTTPESAERFLEITKMNAEIAGLLSAPVPDTVMVELVMSDLRANTANVEEPLRLRLQPSEPARSITPVNFGAHSLRRRSRSRFSVMKWAAVLVGLIAVAAIVYSGFWRSAEEMKMVGIEGEVYFISNSGETRVRDNDTIGDGKVKTVGRSSRVTIALDDGTRVDVGGDTALAIRAAKDKARFFLESGSLKSEVAKQKKSHSLVFATPEAEAIVVGTKLRLVVSGHSTRLEVTEGEMRFRRLRDGAEVRVRVGEYAIVAPNVPLVATPHHPDPHHAQ